jgi:polysaccharide export outer membrane protein
MATSGQPRFLGRRLLGCFVCFLASGCTFPMLKPCGPPPGPVNPDLPRELQKVSLPEYVIEPPDILLIDVVQAIPRAPYRISTLDVLYIEDNLPAPPLPPAPGQPTAPDPLEKIRLSGNYSVQPGGLIDLGAFYGSVVVEGMTLEEAKAAIQRRLEAKQLKTARVERVTLVQIGLAQQQIVGEHLVSPDGTVSLGTYGQVYVTGLTRQQARSVIEAYLSQFFDKPKISLDVFAFNSKVYYVILQGHGAGDGVYRMPVTGNETVLDAVSHIQGLQPYSSRKIWVARPAPPGMPCDQVLPVDWHAITQCGGTLTNYQLMPGDRVYIAEDPWYVIDAGVAKRISPFERLFGFTLLGTETVSRIRFFHRGNFGGGGF